MRAAVRAVGGVGSAAEGGWSSCRGLHSLQWQLENFSAPSFPLITAFFQHACVMNGQQLYNSSSMPCWFSGALLVAKHGFLYVLLQRSATLQPPAALTAYWLVALCSANSRLTGWRPVCTVARPVLAAFRARHDRMKCYDLCGCTWHIHALEEVAASIVVDSWHWPLLMMFVDCRPAASQRKT